MSVRRSTSFKQCAALDDGGKAEAYEDTERFLRDAQEQLSRSFHELFSVGVEGPQPTQRSVPCALRRRKSAVELTGLGGKYTFQLTRTDGRPETYEERPVVRRKRYTRRARKSVTIEPETGLILAGGRESSSSEESADEKGAKRRSRSEQRVRTLSSSATALSSTVEPENSFRQRPHLGRGPAARRANRRFAQKVVQNGSSGHLDKADDSKDPPSNRLRYQKRSMSVRDLNGLEVDFSNQDHVTRWASQILAELDSLPSSRIDLTQCGVEDDLEGNIRKREDSRERKRNGNVDRLSTMSSPLFAETSPQKDFHSDHRHSMFLDPTDAPRVLSAADGLHITPYLRPKRSEPKSIQDLNALNNNRELSISQMHLPTVPTPFLQSTLHRLSMSMHSQDELNKPTEDWDSDCTPRGSPAPSDQSMRDVEQFPSGTSTCAPEETLERPDPQAKHRVLVANGDKSAIDKGAGPSAEARSIDNEEKGSIDNDESRPTDNEEVRPPVPARRRLLNVNNEPSSHVSDRFRRLSPQRKGGHEESYPHQGKTGGSGGSGGTDRAEYPLNSDAWKGPPPGRAEKTVRMSVLSSRAEVLETAGDTENRTRNAVLADGHTRAEPRMQTGQRNTKVGEGMNTSPSERPAEMKQRSSTVIENVAAASERIVVRPTQLQTTRTDRSRGKRTEEGRPEREQNDLLAASDARLQNSIARLTQSVYGDLREVEAPVSPASSRSLERRGGNRGPIPSIRAADLGEEPLQRWRKEAECRSRNPSLIPRSVDRVVASLIHAAEESRLQAADRPQSLRIPTTPVSPAQDVSTQTSPFSLSRSSSFDWVNEPSEKALKELKTPVETPRSEASSHSRVPIKSDSSEDTDCDAEVQEMTRGRHGLHDALDESLALLLQCTQTETPQPKPRTKLPINQKAASCSPLLHKRVLETKGNSESLPTEFRKMSGKVPSGAGPMNGPAHFCGHAPKGHAPSALSNGMNDSVYDNVPGRKSRKGSEEPFPSSSSSSSSNPVQNDVSLSALQEVSQAIENLTRTEPPTRRHLNAFPLRMSERAGSCELLSGEREQDEAFKAKMRKAEEDAHECCDWLRRAGFPQYATQYEEGQFPLDLKAVYADHRFLDADSLQALSRRLQTLNRAAIMRIDHVVLRRRNDARYDDSPGHEEDDVALSGRWMYQRNSHSWSRVGNEPIYGAGSQNVSTRPDRDVRPRGLPRHDAPPADSDSSSGRENRERGHRSLQRSQSERIKERARAIMKKIDIRSSSRRRKPRDECAALVIGDPVLVSYDSASPEGMRMMQNGHHIPAGPSAVRPSQGPHPTVVAGSRGRSKSSRRQGFVLLSPSSPESNTSISDDSFVGSFGTSTVAARRDRSVPPSRNYSIPAELRGNPQYGSAFERYQRQLPRTNPYEPYLYPHKQHSSRARSAVRPSLAAHLDDVRSPVLEYRTPSYPLSLDSSPSNTSASLSPYSQRYQLSPREYSNSREYRTARQQPSVLPDGYFMHEMSPDASLSRRGLSRVPPRALSPTPSPSGSLSKGGCSHASSSLAGPSSLGHPPSTSYARENAHLRVATANDVKLSQSSLDACTDSEEHSSQTTLTHQRRDSGVGSSLSRSPSGPSAQRVRASTMPACASSLSGSVISYTNNNSGSSGCSSWSSSCRRPAPSSPMSSSLASSISPKEEDVFFSDAQLPRCIDALGLLELCRVKKLAYLRVTAVLEKYMGSGNVRFGANAAAGGVAVKNWAVQKLIKKIKQIDGVSKNSRDDNSAFGHSLEHIYKRTGLCLPRSMLEVLRFLRQMSPETVGLFRKNGVRSRIQELREVADTLAERDLFVGENRLLSGQVHDAADLLKQYLRELPEPLMTVKLSETFANIYMHLPENERLTQLQYSLVLLPDENREALQTLLFFLSDVARHSDQNNMNAQNLSVCFTPSLFHLSASRLNTISPTRRHKTIGAAGMPTEREMKEQRAAQACLADMILHSRRLFVVPESLPMESVSAEDDLPSLHHLGGVGYRSYLVRRLKDMLKDHQDRWKGWSVECVVDGVEVSSKKATDSHPLKAFRATTEVDAPPREVLQRMLRERPVWDPATVNWRQVDSLQSDTDIFQYVSNDTVGHPTRDCYVVRMFKSEVPEIRGACAMVERSIASADAQLLGGVRAAVLDGRILVEPSQGRSRVTLIQRIDFRGRGLLWYSKVYTHILARQLLRLRDSYQKMADEGPETKV